MVLCKERHGAAFLGRLAYSCREKREAVLKEETLSLCGSNVVRAFVEMCSLRRAVRTFIRGGARIGALHSSATGVPPPVLN